MPTSLIDDRGNYVYYEDSGIPKFGAQDYTTIILVHGISINSAIFRRILPFASDSGLRIFTMNLRDYRDSSSYSAEELETMLTSDIEVQSSILQGFGRDVANFIAYVCITKGSSTITESGGRKDGGVVLITWSMSNLALLSILGDPETLQGQTKAVLSSYLRKVILYDCPCLIYGIYPDIGLHFPLTSAEVPAEQKPADFAQWVSSYYEALPEDTPITAESLRARPVLAWQPPTLSKLPLREFERAYDPGIYARSALLALFPGEIYKRNFRRTFLSADIVLPDVDVVALWCDQSVWVCLWGIKALEELLLEEPSMEERKRRVVVKKARNANHLLHWDEPERFIQIITDVL